MNAAMLLEQNMPETNKYNNNVEEYPCVDDNDDDNDNDTDVGDGNDYSDDDDNAQWS